MGDKEKNEDVMKFLKKNYRPPKNKKVVAKATTAIVNIIKLIPAICLIIIGLFFSWCTTQMNEDGSLGEDFSIFYFTMIVFALVSFALAIVLIIGMSKK
tara:strand:+ start:496 stop:792 length:297 start_codon:yes stop_codon:yes gene_type:complete